MSTSETVGLCLTVTLLAGIVGMLAGVLWARGSLANAKCAGRHADVLARWLAAQMTLSRAAASFVASFRALAAEPPDGPFFSLREQEAQRARAGWSEAMREWDQAAAAMFVVFGDAAFVRPSAERSPPSVHELRQAIDGNRSEVDAFQRRLHESDERAIEWARQRRDGMARPCRPWVRHIGGAVRAIQNVTDQWARGAGRRP